MLDNNVHDSFRAGVYAGGSVGQSYSNVIDGNEVWRNVKENMSRTWSGGWAQGISLDKSDNSTISNNNVYDNWGEGVGAMFTKGAKITGNKVYDSYSVGIYLDNAQDAVVQYNTVSHSYDTAFYRSGKPAAGIVIANENGDRMLPSSGIVVTDNVLAGVGNLVYSSYGANTGLVNSTTSLTPSTAALILSRLRHRLRSPRRLRAVIRSPRQRMYSRSTRPSAGMSKSFPTSMWPLTRLPWITASLRNCPGQANYRTGSSP